MNLAIPLCLPLGASGLPELIKDIGICLVFAGGLSVVFARLKIPTIAAFLFAGVLAGPVGLGLVTDQESISTIAGLGLVLLLFLIGLEIDPRKLMSSGRTLLITGAVQFPLSVLFGLAVALALQQSGWPALAGGYTPVYVGFMLSSSSTLLVVKLFLERHQLDTVVGRVCLGLLIFQDVWAIVVLAIQPNFANPQVLSIVLTFVDIGLITLFALVFARYVLPHAFRWIAKSPELMLVAATGWCFAVGFIGYEMGHILHTLGLPAEFEAMSVSVEMGALIAGASIAGQPYSYELITKVSSVRDFFVTLFFVGLGMGIPRPEGADVLLMALLLATLSILARYVVFFPVLYWTGLDRRHAFVVSTRLAQVSEFCLVIAYLGLKYNHVDKGFVSAVIFAFVITALLSPLLFSVGDALHDRLGRLLGALGFKPPREEIPLNVQEHAHDIVLLGFHRAASSLLYEIEKTQPALLSRVLVIDFNVALHPRIRARGVSVKYGDISNVETLHHVGVDKATVIVCTITDEILKGTTNLKLVASLRKLNLRAAILVCALEMKDVQPLYDAGADLVLLPRIETGRALLPAVQAAFDGQIRDYRSAGELRAGFAGDRREVMP